MPDVSSDIREVYEMVTKQKPPDPGALERQHTRQVRTMRNRKIGAFAMVAAIAAVAVVVIVGTRGEPNSTNVGTDVTPTPEVVATRFIEAYGAFDADEAMAYLADKADVSELVRSVGTTGLGGSSGLRLAISWLDAVGYEQLLDSCQETSRSAAGGVVRCSFDLHLLRSREIGRGPFRGAYIDLSVVDGHIVRASSMYFDFEKEFSPQVWEPFASWVSTTFPEDAAVMYEDETHSGPRLTQESIRLWERHTKGYVTYVEQQADGQ
jgi:hypothetical protein